MFHERQGRTATDQKVNAAASECDGVTQALWVSHEKCSNMLQKYGWSLFSCFFLISSMLIYVDLCCVFSLLKLKQAQWTYVVLVFLLTCRFAALVVPPLGKCLFCTQPVGSKTKASKSVSDVNFRNWSDHDIQTSCVFFYLAPFMGRRRSKWDVS